MERLHVLGTGNAAVTRCYNTCFTIQVGEEHILCDAGGGNGILRQLEDAGITLGSIHHFIITHAHCDHLLGAVWLLRMIGTAMNAGKYDGRLRIYCHRTVSEGLRAMAALMLPAKICALFDERILFLATEDGVQREMLGRSVTFFDIGSTKMLQFGFTMTLADGRKLCCMGDEPFNPDCREQVEGSAWLLSEAFCLYSQRERFKPYEKHHSTVLDACRLAQELDIPHLVLWHTEDKNLPDRRQLYTLEGRQAYTGDLYVPDDLDVIELT
ncbi:MAG: MBL fold metallo-hydrolase [Clostridiales bacterium]|nr:MBL fold metallo-hydrolase [Clostridiales bacterium]